MRHARPGQVLDELILQIEDLVDRPVELHGGGRSRQRHLEHLRGDPDAIAKALVGAGDDKGGAEPATELERMPIVGAASSGDQVSLQLEHVLARNHRHAADLREVGGQRFGDALPDPLVELIARRFRVIGEPMRIRVLDRLRTGEATVLELTDALGSSQQNVSKHLQVLHDARILSRRKEGTHAYYAIADEAVLALCEQVCGSLQRQFTELNALMTGTS